MASAQEAGSPCPAGAFSCAGTAVAEGKVLLEARDRGVTGVDWGASGVQDPSRCTFSSTPKAFDQERDLADHTSIPRGGIWYIRNCGGSDQYRWYLPSAEEVEDVVVLDLVEEAIDRIEPPAPRLVTSPPLGSPVLTGLPMYLAVDDVAFSEQTGAVSAGQFTVTATVQPVSTWFSPGDQHESRTCEGAGTLWSDGDRPGESDCTHTFTHTPAHLHGDGDSYTVRARVTYQASYTLTGPILAGTYELGTFEGPETVVEVPVVERRAVRTTSSG
jgi:hypothetical protein